MDSDRAPSSRTLRWELAAVAGGLVTIPPIFLQHAIHPVEAMPGSIENLVLLLALVAGVLAVFITWGYEFGKSEDS